ncbi:MAG: GAF domain-containing protein [Bacilli bacterium]|nr:GAF domain-containing protein [Bacilli bacterium]
MSKIDVSIVKSLLNASKGDFRANVLNAFSYIREALGVHSWVGLYRKEEDGLHLSYFSGSVACLYIPFGKGVVGESYIKGEEIYVSDVSTLKNYIACDERSKSEYVMPLVKGGEIKAIFDIDSDLLDGLKDEVEALREVGLLLLEATSSF